MYVPIKEPFLAELDEESIPKIVQRINVSGNTVKDLNYMMAGIVSQKKEAYIFDIV